MMRRFVALLIFCLMCSLHGGCKSQIPQKLPVEVTIDGDGSFPDFLVGRWKADRGGWEFVFEPDGTISSAVISIGRVTMKPGQTTIVPMQLGGKGIFEPGRWAVQYSHTQRELIVEIVIDRFRVELGDSVLRGRIRDFFVGSVSSDGQVWPAERISFPEYIVDTKKYPNRRLPFDPNDNARERLLFQKVQESKQTSDSSLKIAGREMMKSVIHEMVKINKRVDANQHKSNYFQIKPLSTGPKNDVIRSVVFSQHAVPTRTTLVFPRTETTLKSSNQDRHNLPFKGPIG